MMTDEEKDALIVRLRSALREWRDKFGGQAVHVFPSISQRLTASPWDLLRETNRLLEGR
jgi:hypothetical protein